MAGIVNLKVQPQELKNKAHNVDAAVSQMQRDLRSLEQAISGTKPYWIGEAGDLHRKLYNDRTSDFNRIIKDLKEYPVDLLKMADLTSGATCRY